MGNLKISYDNKVDNSAGTLSAITEAPQFPVENVRRRWKSQGWRSGYGSGSGGGIFIITTLNNKFYFEENLTATTLTATITTGAYNADTLAAEIETQMEAAGANTYTVAYDKTNFKFTIDLDTGTNFKLLVATTTNAIWDTIGADTATAYITTWIADNIRIHTYEEIRLDFSTAENYTFFAFFGHNLQSGATVTIYVSDDGFATGYGYTMLRGEDNLYAYFLSASASWKNVKIRIKDIDNPDGFVEIGRLWFGIWDYIPERGRSPEYVWNPEDKSIIKESEGGQVSTIQNPHTEIIPYDLQNVSESDMKDLYSSRGESRELVLLEKKIDTYSTAYADPEDYLKYGRMARFKMKHRAGASWEASFELIKEL